MANQEETLLKCDCKIHNTYPTRCTDVPTKANHILHAITSNDETSIISPCYLQMHLLLLNVCHMCTQLLTTTHETKSHPSCQLT